MNIIKMETAKGKTLFWRSFSSLNAGVLEVETHGRVRLLILGVVCGECDECL